MNGEKVPLAFDDVREVPTWRWLAALGYDVAVSNSHKEGARRIVPVPSGGPSPERTVKPIAIFSSSSRPDASTYSAIWTRWF